MPWCPNCKVEYRPGFHKCSDCDLELVEVLDPESQKEEEYIFESWAYLTGIVNERETEIIESMLKAYDIPVLRKDRGAGGYLKIYMGMTYMGIDLYVPESKIELARELVGLESRQTGAEEKHVEQKETSYDKKQKRRTWVIITYYIIPLLIALLIAVWEQIKR